MIPVRNRKTGQVEAEKVFGEKELNFFYGGSPFGRAVVDGLMKHRWTNRVYGRLQRRAASRRKIPSFVASLGIDASEAELPLEQYDSLDAFFVRRLRPETRPIDTTPNALVAPCDGRFLVFEEVPDGFTVKQSRVTLLELLVDDELARTYQGGSALVARLAPADYHRFHFPEAGLASASTGLGRHLHSVHPIALAGAAPSFRNHRTLTRLQTDAFGTLLLCEVGAMLVGTIVQTYHPGPVERGAEKGYFRFGGSSIVLLAEPGRLAWDRDLVEASRDGIETLVKMGSRIGAVP